MVESNYKITGSVHPDKNFRLNGTILARVYYKWPSDTQGPPLEFRVRVKDAEAYQKLLNALAENKPFYQDEFQVLNFRKMSVLFITYEYENVNG